MKLKLLGLALLALGASSAVAGAAPQGKGHRDQVVKYIDEVWNKGNLAYIDQAVTPNITRFGHVDDGNADGIEAYKKVINRIRSSFTDYNVTLMEMTGVGDTATFTWKMRGNYVGPDHKITPGRTVDIMGKTVWVMRDGKVIREVVQIDPEEYYRQIQMAQPYSEVANRALMLSYIYDVVGRGDGTAVQTLVADDHVLHDLGSGRVVGPAALRQHVTDMRAAFPDLSIKIHDVVADGNFVSARWTLEGTHKGSWAGIPGTGKKMFATGMTFMVVKDNKIQETWNSLDLITVTNKPGS